MGGRADDVFRQRHFAAEQLGQAGGNGLEGELRLEFALGTAQVRAEDHAGAMLHQVLDGGQGGDDTVIVGDFAFFVQRDVEIAADKHPLAFDVDVFDGLLIHSGTLLCSQLFFAFQRENNRAFDLTSYHTTLSHA